MMKFKLVRCISLLRLLHYEPLWTVKIVKLLSFVLVYVTLIKIKCRGNFCKGLPQKWRAWEEFKISCRDEKLKKLSPPWKFAKKIFCVKVRFHFFLSSLVHIVPATTAMQRDQPKHAKYSHDHLCYTSHYTKKFIDCKNITAVFYLFFQQQHCRC